MYGFKQSHFSNAICYSCFFNSSALEALVHCGCNGCRFWTTSSQESKEDGC